ncbi:MAG: (Fe-S)-binding protein [gamma proteobacterium symbiont of Bathyaustriella thionipta]|nr:(Fe-S)-binding protein [gamma proteobacterium symbiont of Bathyaustriella thionipta]MCU7948450.1 (Fe-S)-binding protein [gamma proteobacterium symbiont of Bathyaustriella thionipta]MCU7952446.1 (Fe-S)-binding protein [gamma proteobacterium symbiont of Bathyaustriella thionipta]MCU7955372.1 (Fe-S)-binding protein [gamma proteobacterium symbiont of Bathyaustriella thionipta]MCU7968328.1 (Fe-S)-binding protein [gamma proteobacterium symbiont of Bathyaustriella thionipta]
MTIHKTISQLANQCVLCGICIPHCPTYHVFKTENESPRGRISLLKALSEEQLEPSKALLISLDHCLGCRACEKICPSQVDYGQISRLGRELVKAQYPVYQRPFMQKMIEKVLITPYFHPLLKLAVKTLSPFQSLLSKQSNYAAVRQFSHEIAADSSQASPLEEYYPAPKDPGVHSQSKVQVILFKGCSSDLFEQQVLKDIILLLNACLIDVIIPEQQQCCGAISVRQGDAHTMQTLATQNIECFKSLLQESQAIISLNNSCSAHLKDYKQLLDSSEADEFSRKSVDAISFLSHAIESSNIQFSPLNEKIGVHIPCSLKNVLKEETLLFELLTHIPGIHLSKLNDNYCCGAAGSYMLQYPDVANHLLDDKIEAIAHQQYNTLVSSNIGCSLHFKQGLEKQEVMSGQKIEVIHPVRLLARQLNLN